MSVKVKLECGKEDRVSQEYGPFEFVQITYDELRVGPDGDRFAYYVPEADEWRLTRGPDRRGWSDVVIWADEAN